MANPVRLLIGFDHFKDYIQLCHRDNNYRGNKAAYGIELGNYIADSRISVWIYGYSHHSTDLMNGNTHLVGNPLGYVFCGENSNFNDSAVIAV